MSDSDNTGFPCSACFRILSNCPHCSETVKQTKSTHGEEETFSVQERREQIEIRLAEQEAEERLRQKSQRPSVLKNLNTFNVAVMINAPHFEATGSSAMTASTSSSIKEPQDIPCPGTSPAMQLDIAECDYVNVQAASFTINIGRDVAQIQHITQDIKDAVTDALWAKVAWQNETAIRYRNKYKAEKAQSVRYADWCHNQLNEMKQDLATEKQRKEEEISRIQKIGKEKLKSLSEELMKSFLIQSKENEQEQEKLIQQLTETKNWTKNKVKELNLRIQRERESKTEELSALETHYQEEQQKVREATMTFVLRLEDRDRSVVSGVQAVQSERLSRTVEQLFVQHNIRLLGVSCGLEFLMQAPDSDWLHVVEKELQVRRLLEESLPESARGRSWQHITRVDDAPLDVSLGQRWAAAAADEEQIHPQVTDKTEKKIILQNNADSPGHGLNEGFIKNFKAEADYDMDGHYYPGWDGHYHPGWDGHHQRPEYMDGHYSRWYRHYPRRRPEYMDGHYKKIMKGLGKGHENEQDTSGAKALWHRLRKKFSGNDRPELPPGHYHHQGRHLKNPLYCRDPDYVR